MKRRPYRSVIQQHLFSIFVAYKPPKMFPKKDPLKKKDTFSPKFSEK